MSRVDKYLNLLTATIIRVRWWGAKIVSTEQSQRVRFSMKERILFTKRLAILLQSGMPISRCLVLMRDQAQTQNQKLFFTSLSAAVLSGQKLSTALEKYRPTIGDFTINVVRIGEASGTLAENLEYISIEHKKKFELRRQLIGALVYPAIIILATFMITLFLVVYIFPKIIPIFTSLKIDLPVSTRILIFLSDFLTQYGAALIGVLIILAGTYWVLRSWGPVAHFVDWCCIELPIFGTLCQYYNTVNFCRTLGLLLRNGVPLQDALQSLISSTQHSMYKSTLTSVRGEVLKGKTISSQLALHKKLFPTLCVQMIQSGEMSGNLSHSLSYVSDVYESEIRDMTKNLTIVLEPILMVVMGLCVGFIAISIITPIYSITNNLHV